MSLANQYGMPQGRTLNLKPLVQTIDWENVAFFSPGLTEERIAELEGEGTTLNKAAWEEGVQLVGILRSFREKKNPPPKGAKHYGIFESLQDGSTFVVDAPGKLRWALERVKVGTVVAMTYLGKIDVEKKGLCHDFAIDTGDLQ